MSGHQLKPEKMSGINRFLSRRDKHRKSGQHEKEKVKSPSMPCSLPTPISSSASSFLTSSDVSPIVSSSYQYHSSSSLSSLSSAFPTLKVKGSPRLQPAGGQVYASTANTYDLCLLQPRLVEGHLHDLFSDFGENIPHKDDEKAIKFISQQLSGLCINNFKNADIQYVLNTTYAGGDTDKALQLLVLLEDSENFIVRDYKPTVKLLGAVNRRGTTCYLDATLFAIFARLESFEAILYNTFEDEPRKRLSTLLRLWVNTLRTGKLITTDITEQLQDALANCGWHEAAEQRQQDASEAFSFITDKLELPMLTLKMDIFHTGKEDTKDDHKYVRERLLEVAIPEETPDGRLITLEECLESYFNGRIDVRRYLERRATTTSMRSRLSVDSSKGGALHIESVELNSSQPSTPTSMTPQSPLPPYSPSRPVSGRQRAPSIIQEHYVYEKGDMSDLSSQRADGDSRHPRPRTGSVRKEILMPAWQFFSLIPWYTDTMPSSDAQVAAHFSSKRPILGICLKRYSFSPNGQAIRRGTHIDIPLEIALPHFIHDDNMDEDGPAFGNFKLSLQSVVCHRGDRVDSGHYISLVRGQAPNASGSETSGAKSPEDRWMLFDDLAMERITYVDIQRTLTEESPYLLFYQVQPIDGDPGNIEGGQAPPSYVSEGQDSDVVALSLSSTMDTGTSTVEITDHATPSSSREQPVPQRPLQDSLLESVAPDENPSRTSMSSDRDHRMSVAFTDASFASPTKNSSFITSSPHLPNAPTTPGVASMNASRRPSKTSLHGSRSRPPSQHGDSSGSNRLSMSFTKLAGKLSKDKPDVSVLSVEPKDLDDDAAVPRDDGTEEGKLLLKKENKDRSRSQLRHGLGHPHHLVKGKGKSEKPERECLVM